MMKYIVKLYMEGDFPGSPDHDYYPVDEIAWDAVCKILFRFQRYDTLEDARKEEQ